MYQKNMFDYYYGICKDIFVLENIGENALTILFVL